MKIFVLEVIDPDDLVDLGLGYSPYGSCRGHVVVAHDEAEARAISARDDPLGTDAPWWLNPTVTSCTLVDPSGPRIVMSNEPTG